MIDKETEGMRRISQHLKLVSADDINNPADGAYNPEGYYTGYLWPFLCFRTLRLSDDYKRFCEVMDELDMVEEESHEEVLVEELSTIESCFPEIEKVYHFWGSVNFSRETTESDAFNYWCEKNSSKLSYFDFAEVEFIKAGESVVADEGVVYVTVPALHDIEAYKEIHGATLQKTLFNVWQDFEDNPIFKLKRGQKDATETLLTTQRRLDVYYLKNVCKLSNLDIVKAIYLSDKDCWHDFYDDIHIEVKNRKGVHNLKTGDFESEKRKIDQYNREAKGMINNALNNKFPKYTK